MLKHKSADVAQSVERRLGKAEVTGSIPVISFLALDDQGLFSLSADNCISHKVRICQFFICYLLICKSSSAIQIIS